MQISEEISRLIPLLIPLVVIQLALMTVALLDLSRREKVRGGRKWVWALVIIFVNTIGPIIYLVAGRTEED